MSRRSSHRYPLATIAVYGPDNTRATKLVASVIASARQSDPSAMRTWVTDDGDIRRDPSVAAEVEAFLRAAGVRDRVEADRVLGCPHEEGIDYPMGRVCPRCPFWAGLDRFTHEPIPAPRALMSPDEVLHDLSADHSTQPLDALEAADAHRDALTPRLLEALEIALQRPSDASEEEASLFTYALYLFAKWREPAAYPYVVRWLTLPDDQAHGLGGDVVTEAGGRILAAVADGNLEPIKGLIVNADADESARAMGVQALALLAAWAEIPWNTAIDYFRWLLETGLERVPSYDWSTLAAEAADMEAVELFPLMRRAYDEGLIDPQVMGREELDEVESMPRGEELRHYRERWPPIEDVAEATSWWAAFSEGRPIDSGEPYRAPAKVGRNDPCPCGSGKKYKKCHLLM